MNTFLSLVKSNLSLFSMYDFGLHDLSTEIMIKEVIKNHNIFDDFYNRFPLSKIETMDDYCLYLFSRRLDKLREVIPYLVRDEDKKLIIQIADNAKVAVKNINNGYVIEFINNNINNIFSQDFQIVDLGFRATLDIISLFHTGISKDVFEFLCKNYRNLTIAHFALFEKVFEKHTDLFNILFYIEKSQDLYQLNLDTVLSIWLHILNKNNSNLKSIIEQNIEIFSCHIKKLVETAIADNKEVIFIDGIVKSYFVFLEKIKIPNAHEFVEYNKKTSELSQQYILKYGEPFKYELTDDIKNIIIEFKKIGCRNICLFLLTHKKNEKGCIVSQLDDNFNENGILNIVKTNIQTDDFFTTSHQLNLSATANLLNAIFIEILCDKEALKIYLKKLNYFVLFICKKTSIDTENLQQDTELLLNTIQLVAQNMNNNEMTLRPLCYGASMYCSALTEKLLRIFYRYLVKDETYIPVYQITLEKLLDTKQADKLASAFGENHIKNLSFFLRQVNGVGENIRNSLAHLSGISTEKFTPIFVAKVLWLFTDVLNTIFWYIFLETNAKNNNKTD